MMKRAFLLKFFHIPVLQIQRPQFTEKSRSRSVKVLYIYIYIYIYQGLQGVVNGHPLMAKGLDIDTPWRVLVEGSESLGIIFVIVKTSR